MGPRGTTTLDEQYYRGGRGCKKLHPPLLPHQSGTRPGCRGTTAQEEETGKGATKHEPWDGSTVGDSGTTAGLGGTTAPFGGTAAQNEG